MSVRRSTLSALAIAAVLGTAAVAPAASAETGTLAGFTGSDFLFLNALQTTQGTLGQVTVGQAAAAATTATLPTKNALGEKILAASTAGKNAAGHGADVSVNLGSPPGNTPQIQETVAEATSPPASSKTSSLTGTIDLSPLATANVLPSTAEANTTQNTGSPSDFCPTLGGPISQGTANVALAQVAPVAAGQAVIDLDSAVHVISDERLLPNGSDAFGLSSASTIKTASLTLFKGISGAETNIQIVSPVTLQAFAAGVAGASKVAFGDNGNVNVVKVTTPGGTVLLTLNQLLGGGATIDADGLLQIHIGLTPTSTINSSGTIVDAVADLVKIQVVGATQPSQGTVGGPLGPVLNPILGPVFSALDQTQVFQQIDQALKSAGITTAADLRVGHFEAHAQVPAGGVECTIPVHKTATPNPVEAGKNFVYTITVDNPFNCTLDPVKLVDEISGDPGVKWSVVGTDPKASSSSDDKVVWDNIGPIPAHKSKAAHITVAVDSGSAAGLFTDTATATGDCKGNGSAGNGTVTNVTIHLTGKVTVTTPRVTAGPLPNTTGGPLPKTGLNPALPVAALLAFGTGLGLVAVRRRRT